MFTRRQFLQKTAYGIALVGGGGWFWTDIHAATGGAGPIGPPSPAETAHGPSRAAAPGVRGQRVPGEAPPTPPPPPSLPPPGITLQPPAGFLVPPKTVQLGEVADDGPVWSYANRTMNIPWAASGGDYLDAKGVLNGPAHAVVVPIGGGLRSFDVSSIIPRLLTDNTGFFVRYSNPDPKVSPWQPRISARNSTTGPGPALHIVTDAGSFDAPCVADVELSPSAGSCLGTNVALHTPCLIKFDLGGITGTLISATLTLNFEAVFAGGTSVTVDYLAMPALIYDPVAQVPDLVQYGIASSVAKDSDLASHPSVLCYSQFASDADCRRGTSNWNWVSTNYDRGTGYFNPIYKNWSWVGLHAVRMERKVAPPGTDGSSISSASRYTVTRDGLPFERPIGQQPQELYCRYLLMIDPDVYAGMNELGVKLPGMDGNYDHYIFGNSSPSGGGFSGRMEHSKQSPSNPHLWELRGYFYIAGYVDTGLRGLWLHPNVPATLAQGYPVMVSGRPACVEQHIRLNTYSTTLVNGPAVFHDGLWWNQDNTQRLDPDGIHWHNSDGLIEFWLNGVKVYSAANHLIRADIRSGITQAPWANFFHGGKLSPIAPIHYEWTGVVAATEYIGPPKLQPA